MNVCICTIWALHIVLEFLFFKFLKFRMSRWHFSLCSTWQKVRNSLGCTNCLGHSRISTLGIYYIVILCNRHLFSKPDLLLRVTIYNYDLCVHQFELVPAKQIYFVVRQYSFSATVFRHSFLSWLCRTKKAFSAAVLAELASESTRQYNALQL